MAINGEIKGTAYRSNGNANSDYEFLLKWVRNSYSIENNTSNITITLSVRRTDGYADSAANLNKKPRVTLTINNANQTGLSISYINTRNGQVSTFMSWTGEVSHDNDGSFEKTVAASFTLDGTSSLGSGSVNGTLTIDTIPRATLLEDFSCDTPYFDGILTYIRADAASQSFSHSVSLYIEGRDQPIFSGDESDFKNGEFKIAELYQGGLSEIYQALGDKAQGKLVLGLKTKSGTTQIGEEQRKGIDLSIPESVIPIVSTISLKPVSPKEGKTYPLLQGMNQVQIDVNATAGEGTVIEAYTITVKNDSTEIYNNTLSNLPISLGPFSQPGELIVSVVVKDKRGRVSQAKDSKINCYEYSLPSISSFKAYRGNQDSSDNSDGLYLVYSYEANYSKINDNAATITLYLDNNTGVKVTQPSPIYLGSNTTSHQIYLTIEDNYYPGKSTATKTVLAASRILNIAPDGKGLAIGKKASIPDSTRDEGLFECQWNAEFLGNVTINGDIAFEGKGLVDLIYPIGSIYMSVNSTSPATLFGGTWVQIENTFLLAAGSNYTAGNTGGSTTTTLSANNLPEHSHTAEVTGSTFTLRPSSKESRNIIAAGENTTVTNTTEKWTYGIDTGVTSAENNTEVTITNQVTINKTGSGEAFSNMPPYLAVYMWKRTA